MQSESAVTELVAIKKLLVLALINSGMTQEQIAGALGMDRTTVSRMFPKGTRASKQKGAKANGRLGD